MSTHFMEEAEILGDSVAVLKKGKLLEHVIQHFGRAPTRRKRIQFQVLCFV